ncbi:MAG: transposase [Desulfobacteraceae bacterium]|jgi:transposase
MAKYKHYDHSQDVLIPVSLEDQLIPGTLEFAIHTLVETRMDTSIFDDRYRNDETGRLAYDPKILLKVILLGYARGLISSRKIEGACHLLLDRARRTRQQVFGNTPALAFPRNLQGAALFSGGFSFGT